MNRQTRTLIVLAVAVSTAAVASYSVYRAIASIPERQVEIATKYAVVAATSLPVGTRLTKDSVKVVQWPARTPLEGGFSDVNAVVDRGLVAAVVENEPISESKLAPTGAGAGLPPTIARGMRAMSVSVNEVIGVAGFVVPGTHVDVVTIISRTNDDTIARVVVSNVQVLTSGTRYDQEESRKDGKAIRSTVVTLMVSPVDAERISLAQSEGKLMLALRNPLDTQPTDTQGVRKASLFGAPVAPEPRTAAPGRRTTAAPRPPVIPAVAPPPPVQAAYMVETIRAAKRINETVGK